MTEQFQSQFAKDYKGAIRWKNTSGYSVPPYGCVQVDTYDTDGLFYNVVRPTDEGRVFFLNGHTAVPDGSFGTSPPWDGHSQLAQFQDTEHGLGTTAGPVTDDFVLGDGSYFTLMSNIAPNGGMNVGAVLLQGASSGGSTILFEISTADVACKDYVEVEVLGGPCGGEPTRSEVLNVFDEAGCFLDLPDNEFTNLVGVRGFASKLEMPFVEATGSCPEKPECRWVITQLCCPDPI